MRSKVDLIQSVPCRILSVHDDLAFQHELWRVAAESGHVVTAVIDGEKAFEVARRLSPDIVLLNLALLVGPGRDGRDILAKLKADPATAFIPVLAYHLGDHAFDKRHALELGAEDLLSQPIDPQAVVAKVERIVLRTSSGKFPIA